MIINHKVIPVCVKNMYQMIYLQSKKVVTTVCLIDNKLPYMSENRTVYCLVPKNLNA